MRRDMKRIFHPVGQGAFYSEEFCKEGGKVDFRIVYDCGTKTGKGKVAPVQVVGSAFNDDGVPIDILFISHFDGDHVSMIDELLKHHFVKRVVLPLLPVEESAVLQAYYNGVGNDAGFRLLSNPTGFFGSETAVFRVEQAGDEPIRPLANGNELTEGFPADADVVIARPDGGRVNDQRGKIVNMPSVARIFVPRHSWCYIPYNYKYMDRHNALVDKLNERKDIDRTRLGDASYVSSIHTELKEVYASLQKVKIGKTACGEINENSMVVYAGPPSARREHGGWGVMILDTCEINCWRDDRPACVYSGDSDFRKVKIHNVYGFVWGNVGVVQIPHHGSDGSFSAEFLDESNCSYVCPISAGRHNQHRHPSPNVLKDILVRHSFPLIVDERACSRLIQRVWEL